jgi:hypothetical protein
MNAEVAASLKFDLQWSYWPVLLGTALVGAMMPWYLGAPEVDLRLPLRVLLAGGVLAALWLYWAPAPTTLVARIAPYFLGVGLLDAVWFCLGTFNATGFLVLFAIPVFAATLASRGWLEVCVAAFAGVCAAVTAAVSSQELRWYAGELGIYPRAWVYWQPSPLDALRLETSASGAEQLAMLATFALALLGVSLLGSTAARAFTQLRGDLASATSAQRESEKLVARVLDQDAAPQCLVSQDTGEIITANAAFDSRFLASDGTTIAARLAPEYAEDISRLLDRGEGAITRAACRPSGGFALLDLTAKAHDTDGVPMRLISVRETPPDAITAAAIAEMGIGIAILSPTGRVLASNVVFASTFPEAVIGAHAQIALAGCPGLSGDWWEIAPRRKLRLSSERDGRAFAVTVVVLGANPDTALTALWTDHRDE